LATGVSGGNHLDLNPDGSFTYTPDADFFGNDTFTYEANDGIDDSIDPATVTIRVMKGITPGDVDGIGGITIADAILAARIAGGLLEGIEDWQIEAADIDGDGVTMKDAIMIAQMAIEL